MNFGSAIVPPMNARPNLRRWSAQMLCVALGLLPAAATAGLLPLGIDPAQSRVELAVKATVGSFVGRLGHYRVSIAADPQTARIEEVVFGFQFRDLQTGNAGRNKDMLDWVQASQFPEGRFVLTALRTAASGQFQALGTLTLHGRTREIAFPLAVSREGERYTIVGEARLDTRDFGLAILRSYWLLTVNPLVQVRFHLEGRLVGR